MEVRDTSLLELQVLPLILGWGAVVVVVVVVGVGRVFLTARYSSECIDSGTY